MKKEDKKEKLIGEATAEQILKWKKEHTFIYPQTVVDPDGNKHIAYIRALDETTIEAAEQTKETDIYEATNLIFNEGFVGGSDVIKSYFQFKIGLVQTITEISKPSTFTAKKF